MHQKITTPSKCPEILTNGNTRNGWLFFGNVSSFQIWQFLMLFWVSMLEFEGNNSNKTLNSLNFKGLIPIIPINLLLIEKKKTCCFTTKSISRDRPKPRRWWCPKLFWWKNVRVWGSENARESEMQVFSDVFLKKIKKAHVPKKITSKWYTHLNNSSWGYI